MKYEVGDVIYHKDSGYGKIMFISSYPKRQVLITDFYDLSIQRNYRAYDNFCTLIHVSGCPLYNVLERHKVCECVIPRLVFERLTT